MRPDNKIIVKMFADKIKSANSVFITGYHGMKESDISNLRKKLDAEAAEHRVLKNSIFKVISSEVGFPVNSKLEEILQGSSSFTIGGRDEAGIAKLIVDYAKENENFKIKGGVVEGRILNEKEVKDLAGLPSKQELYAKLVGSICAPLSGIVGVLNANIRNIVGVISAIKDKKESNK